MTVPLLLLLTACGAPPAGEPAQVPSPPAEPAATLPKGSLYDLLYRLTDADGREIGLDVHRGHPTIVAMFYASCTQACPLMIGKVQGILAALDPAAAADARVLLISIDPEHDTPEALRAAGALHQLDTSRWVLARPAVNDLRPIAALLDVRYAAQSTGQFSHTSPITLLDREGHMVLRQAAVTDPKEPVVAAIQGIATR